MVGRKEFSKKYRPSELSIVFAIQRASIDHWVNTLRRNYKERGIGVIYVSKRADGTLAIVDGQHRVLALRALGIDTPVHCHVYTDLTEEEECEQFLLLNTRRNISAVDKFRLAVGAGLPNYVAANAILHERGLAIEGDANMNGHVPISCAAAVIKEYDRGERERGGPQALACGLDAILAAWGTDGSALEGHVVSGVSQIYHANGWVENDHLVSKLAKYPAGAAGVLGKAKGRREYEGGGVGTCVAKVVIDAYNVRRNKNRLEYP